MISRESSYTQLCRFFDHGEDGDVDEDVDTQGQERGVFNETGRNCRCRGLITAPTTTTYHHLPLDKCTTNAMKQKFPLLRALEVHFEEGRGCGPGGSPKVDSRTYPSVQNTEMTMLSKEFTKLEKGRIMGWRGTSDK